jgi:hypothetical protein
MFESATVFLRRRRHGVRASNDEPANAPLVRGRERCDRADSTVGGHLGDTVRRRSGSAPNKKGPACRTFSKRLMGLEPTTFCMASSSNLVAPSCFFPANAAFRSPRQPSAVCRVSSRFDGVLSTNCQPRDRAPRRRNRLAAFPAPRIGVQPDGWLGVAEQVTDQARPMVARQDDEAAVRAYVEGQAIDHRLALRCTGRRDHPRRSDRRSERGDATAKRLDHSIDSAPADHEPLDTSAQLSEDGRCRPQAAVVGSG